MSGVATFPVAPDMEPSGLEAEVEYLRRMLDKQPCCLLRVGLDGQLLAANDAALQELGARDLGEALDRPFTNWIVPEHHARWQQFVAGVRDSGSGDEECDMVGPEGAPRAVLVKAVLLADHPDGIASVLLVVRDISGTRRLEEALQIHAGTRRALAEVRQRLEEELAAQQILREAIEQRDAGNRRLQAERSELARQLELLQPRLDSAVAEQGRLEGLLEEQERHRKALIAAHDDERAGAERTRAEAERALAEAQRAREEASTGKEQALKALEALAAETTRVASLAREFAVGQPCDTGGNS